MKYNKNRIVTFNNNVYRADLNKNSNQNIITNYYPNKNNIYFENNNKQLNYLQKQNRKNEGGMNILKHKINDNSANGNKNQNRNNNLKNSLNSKIINNIQSNNNNKLIKKRPPEILTENINFNCNNKNPNNRIINDYSPNYSQFDNISNKENNYSKVAHLNLKKLEFLQRFNTDRKNSEKGNPYVNNYTMNNGQKDNKLFIKKPLVINTNNYKNYDYDEEKNKTENENNNDFHKYLKMSAYFSNSQSKNKKDNHESNINFGNQTEKLRNKILFDGNDKKINSLITQGRINNLRQIHNYNLDQNEDEYYNNTVNNFHIQKRIDYKFNTDFAPNYYLVYKENKLLKKTLSSSTDSNYKYQKDNLQKNKNVNKDLNKKINMGNTNCKKIIKNKNEESLLNKNKELLKTNSYNLDLSSIPKKKDNINKKIDDIYLKEAFFIVKKRNGETIGELEIKDDNINEINKYIEEHNIKINDDIFEFKLKNEIDDLNKKYEKIQNELNILKEKYLDNQKKNEELIYENKKLKEENRFLKNYVDKLENQNNKLIEEKKNLEINNNIKNENKNVNESNHDNKEVITNKISEADDMDKNNNYKKKYKRREINDLRKKQ